MADDYDAILIGAGHNSLAAGLHLAAKGWRVGIFEAASEPGGAVKTGAYTAPGFRHDWAAMNLSLFAGSPFFKAHGAELARHGLEFVPVAQPFASSFPDGTWLGVSTDAAATTACIAEVSPEDAKTWAALAAAFPAEAPHLFGLLGSPMKLRALASFAVRTLRAKGVGGSLDLLRFLFSSPRQYLDETFRHPKTRALLAAWGMHLDFAPDVAGGALFPYLEGMAAQAFGMVIGKGGADTIIRAMTAAIAARGGTLTCNAEVTGITRQGGLARGITLADGRRFTARHVIANLAPRHLARLIGPTVPVFDAALAGFSHAPGTMMIHLATSALPEWRASAALKGFAYVHLAPDMDQMARTYQQARAGLLPEAPVIVVGQPTAFDPSRAPQGRHALWIQVRMAPGRILGDAAGEITATDWAEAAEPFAARALGLIERHAPGFTASILARRVVPPSALEADNPNLVGGDQLCGSHHLAQHFLFRPARGHADGSTPIRNLHLTGAAVWPGAGLGAGPGYLLARKLAGN